MAVSGLLLCFYVREARPGALPRGWLRLGPVRPSCYRRHGQGATGLGLGAWAQGSTARLGRSGPGPPAAGFVLSPVSGRATGETELPSVTTRERHSTGGEGG